MKKFQLLIGLLFIAYATYAAVFFKFPHFYTYFTLGTFLLFDWIDYKLTGNSILRFFLKRGNRKRFLLFLTISTVMCFLVDYVYGVRLTGMWQWPHYDSIHFVRMYIVMNPTFVLGSYELYQIIKHFLSRYIKDITINELRQRYFTNKILKKWGLPIGILFLLLPLYILLIPNGSFIEYTMLFPFISVILIPDAITALKGNSPFISKIVGGNKLAIAALLVTVLSSSAVTEFLNLFAKEWQYLKMPFIEISIGSVPLAVFLGWIPLIAGVIAIVNMIKPESLGN